MRSLAVVLTALVFLALSGCSTNANPDTPPPPSGTAISKVGVNCTFKVTASDPDLDRVSVRIDWNSGDTSDWSEMFRSGDTLTLTATGVTETYTIMQGSGQQNCWTWVDRYQLRRRLFTKLTGTA